jgi:hypothetical protein
MLRSILLTLLLIFCFSAESSVRQPATISAILKPNDQDARQQTEPAGNTPTFSARPFPYQRVAMHPKQSYQDKYCVMMNTQWTVCHHVPLDSDEVYFALMKEGRLVGTWPSQMGVEGGARFEVVTADLDGDHHAELIVAHCLGSNTASHEIWRLAIIPNFATRGFTKPLQFNTEQYAAAGTFLQTPGDPLCNLLIAEWQLYVFEPQPPHHKDFDFIGRWYHYKEGMLEPIVGRVFRVRRWADAWYRVPVARQNPYDWLRHPSAKIYDAEPLTRTEIVSKVRGEVVKAARGIDEYDNRRLDISLRLPTGETRDYHLYSDDLVSEPDQISHLGDARTGTLLPNDYKPPDLNVWLVGKQVRIVDYKSRYDAVRRILWV